MGNNQDQNTRRQKILLCLWLKYSICCFDLDQAKQNFLPCIFFRNLSHLTSILDLLSDHENELLIFLSCERASIRTWLMISAYLTCTLLYCAEFCFVPRKYHVDCGHISAFKKALCKLFGGATRPCFQLEDQALLVLSTGKASWTGIYIFTLLNLFLRSYILFATCWKTPFRWHFHYRLFLSAEKNNKL